MFRQADVERLKQEVPIKVWDQSQRKNMRF